MDAYESPKNKPRHIWRLGKPSVTAAVGKAKRLCVQQLRYAGQRPTGGLLEGIYCTVQRGGWSWTAKQFYLRSRSVDRAPWAVLML